MFARSSTEPWSEAVSGVWHVHVCEWQRYRGSEVAAGLVDDARLERIDPMRELGRRAGLRTLIVDADVDPEVVSRETGVVQAARVEK